MTGIDWEPLIPDEGKLNFSDIPTAEFIEDVDSYMEGQGNAEEKLKALDEIHRKYKFMETNMVLRRKKLQIQIPDINSSLAMIQKLENKKETEVNFLLSDQVYAKAKIPPTNKVCLWLGANVMLEYSLEDANILLNKNKVVAMKQLGQIAFDLNFLRDQMTITEVSMARLYNWDVRRRQKLAKKA